MVADAGVRSIELGGAPRLTKPLLTGRLEKPLGDSQSFRIVPSESVDTEYENDADGCDENEPETLPWVIPGMVNVSLEPEKPTAALATLILVTPELIFGDVVHLIFSEPVKGRFDPPPEMSDTQDEPEVPVSLPETTPLVIVRGTPPGGGVAVHPVSVAATFSLSVALWEVLVSGGLKVDEPT
jgi:hypothetical protein